MRTVLAFVILVMVVAVSVGWGASDPAEIAEASNPDETAAALTERAAAHISKGEYQKALPLLQRALEMNEKQLGPEHPETVNSLDWLAFVYYEMRDYPKALPLYQRALEIREKLGPEHLDTAISLNNLAFVYYSMRDYQKALPLLERALEIREKRQGPEHPDTAAALNDLADLYESMGNYQKALPLYQRALAIREKLGPEHPDTATALNDLAGLYLSMGEYSKALPLYQRALAIREKRLGPEHPDTTTSLGNLAFVYYYMGEYPKALPLYQRALAIREKLGPEHPDTAAALSNLAALYRTMGEYQKALPLYQRALAIREKLGPEHPDTAYPLNNLAVLYADMMEYQKALPLHQRALAIREKRLGPEHPDTALSLDSLASLYLGMGEYPKALLLLDRALAIREKRLGPEHPDTATALRNLAWLYLYMGDYPKALPLFQRALEINEKRLGPEHTATASSLSNLASSYLYMGNYQKALTLYQRALAIQEKQLGPEYTASILNNLGVLYRTIGDYPKALPLLERALAIREKQLGPEHPTTTLSLNRLASLYRNMGEYQKAFESFQAALNAEDHTLANVFAITSENQKLQFVQRSDQSYPATLSLIHRHFQKDTPALRFGLELVLRRKGIVLDAQSQSSATLVASLKGETLESWQRLIQHQSNLAHLLLSGPGKQSTNAYQQAIAELEAAIAKEEQFLLQRSNQVAQVLPQPTVTAEMLAKRLPPDSVLVEFVHIRDWDEKAAEWADTSRYLAFVLTPDNQVRMVDLGDAQQIDTKIITTLETIDDPDYWLDLEGYSHRADAALSELYRLLFQPLAPAVGSHQQLLVSPDGELNKVPFAALRAPDGRYLVETHTVSYVASGRDLLRGDSAATSDVDLLLLANPAYGAPPPEGDFFWPLPGTAEEAKAIRLLVKGKQLVLEGQAAMESAVRAAKSPKVLHLATHGFFLEDQELPVPAPSSDFTVIADAGERGPGGVEKLPTLPTNSRSVTISMVRSGLALAGANQAGAVTNGDDGVLTALEVTGLNLYGTDLVVLSACQTGVGEVRTGEGVFGLRRAFVLAGAKNLVMSQWLASDYYTALQMEQFYQAIGRGVSPAAALREAQLAMISSLRERKQREVGEPIAPVNLWAPFMVQQTGG